MADETAIMQQLWPRVLEATKRRRRFIWMLLSQNMTAFSFDGALLTLAWLNQGAMDNFAAPGSVSLLEEAIEEALGRQVAVESVLGTTPPEPPLLITPSSSATQTHLSATIPPSPSPRAAVAASGLHRALGQTAFLMHARGENQATALLTEVEDVELVCGSRAAERADALLIVPPSLMPRFTDEILAAIEPVFVYVAGRHGLQVNGVRAAAALPEVGEN
ncbi:hypothetical protein [Streptomyces sp. NPDC047046]|uniref:hypothetical protein n=1 Tax=Streptomyces sp. NPDC047046 TaxID=3155378 RepID=UPI0033EB5C5C